MYIVSKDKKAIINLEQISTMYIGSDGCSIKADYISGNGCQVGRYSSDREAKKAMELVANAIGKSEVCFMPDDDAVKAKMNSEEQKYRHITGKKTKGRGGS